MSVDKILLSIIKFCSSNAHKGASTFGVHEMFHVKSSTNSTVKIIFARIFQAWSVCRPFTINSFGALRCEVYVDKFRLRLASD